MNGHIKYSKWIAGLDDRITEIIDAALFAYRAGCPPVKESCIDAAGPARIKFREGGSICQSNPWRGNRRIIEQSEALLDLTPNLNPSQIIFASKIDITAKGSSPKICGNEHAAEADQQDRPYLR